MLACDVTFQFQHVMPIIVGIPLGILASRVIGRLWDYYR